MAENNQVANVPKGRGMRIVLFGPPNAGKSSLLGALYQVSQSQEPVLGGKINDLSGGLKELHQRLYSNQPRETLQEVTAYPITLEPTGEQAKAPAQEAVLIDCDGRVAQEYLTQNRSLAGKKGALARAILQADALVLLVDPTTGSNQLEKEFQLFCNFVQTLEKYRSERNEVAGLPIYLVLTKCDLLSKPTDPGGAWVQRIEEGKRKIDKRFQEFLARLPYRPALLFGKVDVHLWATAVRRPQLADKPARAQEPYGVAELFRQCFQAAHGFHEHKEKVHGKLHVAVMGFLGLISFMALAAGLFFVTRPSAEVTRIEGKISEILPAQKATSADRLREPLDQRLQELENIKQDPAFAQLPSNVQEEVNQAYQEMKAYSSLNKKFLETIFDPKFAKDEKDLVKSEKSLDQWAMAAEYQDHMNNWQETRLAKKEQQLRKDIVNLRQAVDEEEKFYKDLVDRGNKLVKQGARILAEDNTKEKVTWLIEVNKFLEVADQIPRQKDSARLQKSPTITYGTVNRFPKVEQARGQVGNIKETLIALRKNL